MATIPQADLEVEIGCYCRRTQGCICCCRLGLPHREHYPRDFELAREGEERDIVAQHEIVVVVVSLSIVFKSQSAPHPTLLQACVGAWSQSQFRLAIVCDEIGSH